MPKRSLIDQLENAIQAMLPRPDSRLVSPREDFDPSVAALLGIARDLRDLPREDFKVRLRTNLERSSQMENAAKQAISSDASKQAETMPGGYHTIAPYIIVPRAGEFIEFLTNAFAGTERFRVGREPGSELIMHAEVAIGNSIVELADANEQIPAAPMAIHLYFDDADAFYTRAIEAGATSIYEVGDHVSGDRQGAVRDPFGNVWYVSMKQGWTPGPEGVPSVQPYLHLRGDDADAMYARAIRAGATSIDAPSDRPYGRSGGVKDPFGNSWYVTSPLQQKT